MQEDEAHEKELGDDDVPRDTRDTLAAALNQTVVEQREIALGLFGPSALSALGFSGTTPRDPVALERFAGEVASTLRRAKPGKPRVPGAQWDGAAIADDLDAKRAALRAAVDAVTTESREAHVTLEAKNRAFAAHDAAYTRVAAVLSGLLGLAGNIELADKVWPSTRRRAAADEPEEPE